MIINSSIPCNGTLIAPQPVSNGCLLMLFLITRHGARSPSQNWARQEFIGTWECGNRFNEGFWRIPYVNNEQQIVYKNNNNTDNQQKSESFSDLNKVKRKIKFPPSCPRGNLLDYGVDQLLQLGRLYRHYLVDVTKLLPQKYDSKNIFVRSSFAPRCIESAVAIMNGFYPPMNDNEILNITTDKFQKEPLCPYSESSDEFNQLAKEFVKKDEFEKRKKFFKGLSNLHKFLNFKIKNEMDNLVIADFLNCYRCSRNELPFPPFKNDQKKEKILNENILNENVLNESDFDTLMSNMAFYDAGFLDFAGNISYMPILELIINHIDKYFEMDEFVEKFFLFSGHDATISAVLVALGILDLRAPPPFASHLAIELWQIEKPFMRFVYNGEVIKFKGKELTPLDEFRSTFFPTMKK